MSVKLTSSRSASEHWKSMFGKCPFTRLFSSMELWTKSTAITVFALAATSATKREKWEEEYPIIETGLPVNRPIPAPSSMTRLPARSGNKASTSGRSSLSMALACPILIKSLIIDIATWTADLRIQHHCFKSSSHSVSIPVLSLCLAGSLLTWNDLQHKMSAILCS